MSAPAWLAAAGLTVTAPAPPTGDAASAYPGEFSALPAQLWHQRLPGARVASAVHTEPAGPLLYGDLIFTGSAAEDALLMAHRRDGRLLGRLSARGAVRSTPVIVGDRLFYGDSGGATWCWRLVDGRPVAEPEWVHVGPAPVLAPITVTDTHVFIADVANVVVALDRQTGELAWRHAQKLDPGRSAELELYGHPAPALYGDVILAGFSDGTLVGLDRAAGDLLWQRRVGEGQYPDLVAPPLVVGDDAIVGGFTAPLAGLDLTTRNIRWRLDEVGAAHAATLPPDADGRTVFHGGADGVLRSINRVTGAVQWEWDSETRSALTQPIVTPAGVVVGAASGSLYVVDAATGEQRWEWLPGFHVSGITAQPAIEGRQLVAVTNAGFLVSLVVPEVRPEAPDRPLLDRLAL